MSICFGKAGYSFFLWGLHAQKDPLGNDQYSYGGWWSVWWTGTYSMVLSKAAFIHNKYFDIYTNDFPASLRKYVKERRYVENLFQIIWGLRILIVFSLLDRV